VTGANRNEMTGWYRKNNYLSAFISISIISPLQEWLYMLRQIMVVIITPQGHGQ